MNAMKDSGILWIGDIPKHWEKCKIKNVCSLIGSGTTPSSGNNEFYENGSINWIQSGDIYGKTEITEVSSLITEKALKATPSLKIYEAPFIVVAMYGGSVGNTAISNLTACTNQACCCVKPDNTTDLKFLYYWIEFCKTDFLYKAEGGGQPNISQDKIKNQYFIKPPLMEQTKISSFLDNLCGQVDALISNVQMQINTLEEYKRRIIIDAVTKGLNSCVILKNSNLEWVGSVPEHWNVAPLYCYFGERKNKNKLGKEQNLLSLSYGKIIRKDINTNGGLLPASFNTYNIVEAGDIIIRPTDLQNDKRSLRTGYAWEHGIITSAYIALKPIADVNTEYMHYLLHAYDVMKVFYNMGNGVRQGLNFDEFKRLIVLEPPKEEQDKIVEFLNEKCAEIEAVIADKKAQLETLNNYKKSIIFEYVTGKKEVV